MKVSVVRPDDLDGDHLATWLKWQREDPRLASPFLAPEFAVAFGHHHEEARVAIVEDGPDLVAFFPFEQHRFQVGRSFAFDLSDSQAIICSQDQAFDPLELLAGCGLAVWEFDHLVGHQAQLFRPRYVVMQPAPVVDLRDGYETWLANKRRASQSRMKKVLQKTRKLEREIGTLQFQFNSLQEADLAQLMERKAAQYVRTGRSDRFADKRFRGFVEELFAVRTEDFQMRLSRLDAGDENAALYLSLRANGRLAGWFPTYTPELAGYSPGMACMLSLIEAAADDGLQQLDLGEGAAAYKESFKNFDDEVADGWSERPVPAALLRRAHLAPKRAAMKIVLNNPRLRLAARKTLSYIGSARAAVDRRRAD